MCIQCTIGALSPRQDADWDKYAIDDCTRDFMREFGIDADTPEFQVAHRTAIDELDRELRTYRRLIAIEAAWVIVALIILLVAMGV